MQSKLAEKLKLKHNPVAILWSDDKPDGARQFTEGRWGCVMSLFAQAARGKTAVFDRDTCGCFGGGTGLGFGNVYEQRWPGGIECFHHFLSIGNIRREGGEESLAEVRPYVRDQTYDNLAEGERYVKSPELVKKYLENLPMIDVPAKYVVFRPLPEVDEKTEEPVVVVFPVNPDQLSALTVMAHYERDDMNAVYAPFCAGCQSVGILAYHESKAEKPRAVIGLTDISARVFTAKTLGKDILTFAVPLKMFHEMESNVEGSFLDRHSWQKLQRINEPEDD